MMPRDLPGGLINVDKWDGAPAARTRLLQGLRDRQVANAVVLTGDSHQAWVADLRLDEAGPAIATEFGATSITSGGDGSETVASTADLLRRNPHIRFFNNRRGYTLHEATPARMLVTQRAVPFVTKPGAPREDRGQFVVEAGRPGVQAG
jgi:alkaline phosphatase D